MQAEVQHFASAPKPVGAKRKYRNPEGDDGSNNMMHDKRVVRGNTYASAIEPKMQQDPAETSRQREAQRRRLMRANQTKKRVSTPEPLAGRKHMDIQTDSYMEELTERTVEFEAETQTDFLLDRPPSPLFMPAKIGVDIDTQIESGDLFDFDVECEPVLEVLLGKTLEQGMMEVLEEEELESLRRHQEDFEQRRGSELLEVQRMESAEKRRDDELKRRMTQQSAQREADLSTMRKVASRSIAAAFLGSVKDRTLAHLLDAGVFTEATKVGVESVFMPSLFKMVQERMASSHAKHSVVGKVIQSAVQEKLDKHEKVLGVERARLRAIDDAELEARAELDEERKRQKAEEERILKEKDAAAEWDALEPPPPVYEDVVVSSIDAETQKAILAPNDAEVLDGPPRLAVIPENKLEELAALLQQLADMPEEERGAQRVLAQVEEGKEVLENIRLGVLGS